MAKLVNNGNARVRLTFLAMELVSKKIELFSVENKTIDPLSSLPTDPLFSRKYQYNNQYNMQGDFIGQTAGQEQFEELLSKGDELIEELNNYFEDGLEEITKDIEALYGKFSEDNNLSNNKAVELIKGSEYKRWRMTMEEYLKKIDLTSDRNLILELNTLTIRKRISRLEALQAEILAHISLLAQDEEKYLTDLLTNSLENSYYKSMYEEYRLNNPKVMELMDKNIVKLSKEEINNVLTFPWRVSEVAFDNYEGFDYRVDNNNDIEHLIDKVKGIMFQLNLI